MPAHRWRAPRDQGREPGEAAPGGPRLPGLRARQLSRRREARLRARGTKGRFAGYGGAVLPGLDYRKLRPEIERAIGPEAMADILDAWRAGDDDRALELFNDAFGDAYEVPNWQFGDVDVLDFLRDYEE